MPDVLSRNIRGYEVPASGTRGIGRAGLAGLGSVFGTGPSCAELPTDWDDYCDCVFGPDDSGQAANNTTCKSKPNVVSFLFAPWTQIGAKARAEGAPNEATYKLWSEQMRDHDVPGMSAAAFRDYLKPGGLAQTAHGGTPAMYATFKNFSPLIGVNKLALGAGALALGAVGAAILLRKKRGGISGAVSGFLRRSRRRRSRR